MTNPRHMHGEGLDSQPSVWESEDPEIAALLDDAERLRLTEEATAEAERIAKRPPSYQRTGRTDRDLEHPWTSYEK